MKVDDEPGSSKLRDYEAVVELANRTKEPLGEQEVNKIEDLIKEIDNSDDIVFQVNCLQLVADLACSKQALAILERKEVPKKLIGLLSKSDPLIVPHALKLFYRINPSDLKTKYPQVLDLLCDYCQAGGDLLDYAVDIIASIGRAGYPGRKVLDEHPQFKEKCLSQLGSTIISSNSVIKSRTLRCITDLLELHDEDPKDESIQLSENFYHAIITGKHKMTNQLLALCRVPFIEIRVGAMHVVASVANQLWAQRELSEHSNFFKWILDRSSEACKEGKEAKFEILKALVKSPTTVRVFKGEDYMKMRADFKNGPFHVGVAEEMMMDNQQA